MWDFFWVHIGIILVFLILGWAVMKKEGYWLISGFSSRPIYIKLTDKYIFIDDKNPKLTWLR
jgi:hypothetical protein